MIVKYIREKTKGDEERGYKGKPIGVIVALDKDHIGWSLLNPRDQWNKTLGKYIAIARAKMKDEKKKYKNLLSSPRHNQIVHKIAEVVKIAQKYDFNRNVRIE